MPESFEDELESLKGEWLGEGGKNESPEELGNAIMDFILRRERLRHFVQPGTPEAAEIDRRTMEKLHQPDTLDPEHSVFEVFIRRLSRDRKGAVQYLVKFVEDRRKRLSKIASKPRPRGRNGITLAIHDCLEGGLSSTAKEVGAYLREHPNIQLIDGIYRHAVDGSTMREGLLASRVSSARKTLKKNSG